MVAHKEVGRALGSDPSLLLNAPYGEVVARKLEGHFLGLAGSKGDRVEALEERVGGVGRSRRREVELGLLGTVDLASVLDREGDGVDLLVQPGMRVSDVITRKYESVHTSQRD